MQKNYRKVLINLFHFLLVRPQHHRVILPVTEEGMRTKRRSLAYFSNPNLETMIEPVPGDRDKYPAILAQKHLFESWREY